MKYICLHVVSVSTLMEIVCYLFFFSLSPPASCSSSSSSVLVWLDCSLEGWSLLLLSLCSYGLFHHPVGIKFRGRREVSPLLLLLPFSSSLNFTSHHSFSESLSSIRCWRAKSTTQGTHTHTHTHWSNRISPCDVNLYKKIGFV